MTAMVSRPEMQASAAEVQKTLDMLAGTPVSPQHTRAMSPDEAECQRRINELLKHRGYSVWRINDEQIRDAVILLKKCEEATKKAAAKAFAKMGPQAMQCVAEQLGHTEPPIRAVAAELMGYTGLAGAPHVDVVAKLLADEDGVVRRCAVGALGALGEAGQTKAASVAQLLEDPDSDVRRTAVDALRRMAAAGRDHVEAIMDLLNDREWTVRRSAVDAIGHMMVGSANPFTDELAEKLTDEEWLVRGAACEALGRLGEHAVQHREKIQPLLVDKEWYVRNVAAEALFALGPQGKRLLEIHHEGMRSSAAEMLATRLNAPKPTEVVEAPKPEQKKEKKGRGQVTSRAATKAVYKHQQDAHGEQIAQLQQAHRQTVAAGMRGR